LFESSSSFKLSTISSRAFPVAAAKIWNHNALSDQSCAPTNWWSAAALGGLMTGGGGAPRIFHRLRRRGFMVGGGGVGGVRPNERTLKQRTRCTGVYSWFYRGQLLRL